MLKSSSSSHYINSNLYTLPYKLRVLCIMYEYFIPERPIFNCIKPPNLLYPITTHPPTHSSTTPENPFQSTNSIFPTISQVAGLDRSKEPFPSNRCSIFFRPTYHIATSLMAPQLSSVRVPSASSSANAAATASPIQWTQFQPARPGRTGTCSRICWSRFSFVTLAIWIRTSCFDVGFMSISTCWYSQVRCARGADEVEVEASLLLLSPPLPSSRFLPSLTLNRWPRLLCFSCFGPVTRAQWYLEAVVSLFIYLSCTTRHLNVIGMEVPTHLRLWACLASLRGCRGRRRDGVCPKTFFVDTHEEICFFFSDKLRPRRWNLFGGIV